MSCGFRGSQLPFDINPLDVQSKISKCPVLSSFTAKLGFSHPPVALNVLPFKFHYRLQALQLYAMCCSFLLASFSPKKYIPGYSSIRGRKSLAPLLVLNLYNVRTKGPAWTIHASYKLKTETKTNPAEKNTRIFTWEMLEGNPATATKCTPLH